MTVGVRGLLLSAIVALALPFGAAHADDQPHRSTNRPVEVEQQSEPEQAAPEPPAKPRAERASRRSRAEARAEAKKARADRQSRSSKRRRDEAAPEESAAIAATEAPTSDTMTPLTVKTYGAYGDALSAQLTLRDLARKERRMKPVMAAPVSLRDRPAPALPGDKHEVDEVGEEPEVASPKAPRAPDAPTTKEEAAYLIKQTPRVMMHCFPASLRSVLTRMSKHFGSPVIVTSGFRTGGRRHSQHRYCKAADIQIAGVRPSQIVGYAQLQDEVGGIGTYRHTRSVHVDVREQKISWYGNRGRGHFRLAKNQFGTN